MTFSETLASAPWIIFRLCYPINSLKPFELPTVPRTANPFIRSGHRSVHHTEETSHTWVFLFTLHFYIFAVERAMALSWSDLAFIYSSSGLEIIHITRLTLLCFQRLPLWGIWPNKSDFLSDTLTSNTCNSDVTSANCDLHSPVIKIRCSGLRRREISG